jgi:hypothetical protein
MGKSVRDPYSRNLKEISPGGITRVEIGNLLENFKMDILSRIGSHLDTLNIKKKQEEENATMSIFFPRCRRKHSSKKCPLDNILVCGFYTEYHPTEKVSITAQFVSHLQKWGSWGILLCT